MFLSRTLLLYIICAGVISGHAATLREIGTELLKVNNYSDSCVYEVTLPNMSDPVRFGIRLYSKSAETDTLTDATYLIEWRMLDSEATTAGFAAYFEGNHFRFRDRRLQEYHASVDLSPFTPNGETRQGVQQRAQFYELLPQAIGRKFTEMAADTSFSYTIGESRRQNRPVIKIKGKERKSGYDASEFEYYLDANTYLPVYISLENNPGQIGEQTVSVTYMLSENFDGNIDMDFLTERHGDELERYRTDGYTLENLPGKAAPRLSARTLSGERYIFESGASLTAPTIFAILDSTVGTTPNTIREINQAIAALPFRVNVVWAFIDKRAEDVAAVTESIPEHETVLISAGTFARDTGAGHLTPVLIFVNRAGTVTDYIRGYNQDLVSLVIEKSTECTGAEM